MINCSAIYIYMQYMISSGSNSLLAMYQNSEAIDKYIYVDIISPCHCCKPLSHSVYNLQSIVHNNCWEYKPWSNIMSTVMVLESHKRLKLPLLDPQNHLSGHCHHQRFWTNASVLRVCSYKCSLQLGDSILACHFGWPTLPILMGDKLAGSVEIVILFCHECPARPPGPIEIQH